jgi:hypothetical protein
MFQCLNIVGNFLSVPIFEDRIGLSQSFTEMSCGLDNECSILDRDKDKPSDRLWDPPDFLSDGYPGSSFTRSLSFRAVKVTIHVQLAPKSRMMHVYLHSRYLCLT